MSRSVFYGFPAFVGSFTSATKCSFWTDDPAQLGWPSPNVSLDLSNNPEAVRRGTITDQQVQVDDHASMGTGGMTRIGPMFPGGTMIGAAYLQEGFMTSLGLTPPGPRPYELSTIQYYASEPAPLTNRRFYGFHAQIVSMLSPTLALVSLYARGTSSLPNAQPMGTWPLDLAQQVHPQSSGLTQITAAGQSGPLYIDARAGSGGAIVFDIPKVPKAYGGIVVARRRRAV